MQVEIFRTQALRNLETGEIIFLLYRNVKCQNNGLMIVEGYDGLYGVINKTGKEIVPPQYHGIEKSEPNGLTIVQGENKLYGLINEKGEEIVPPKYKDMY